MNNLPTIVTWQRTEWESNPRPLDRESDLLTNELPSHNSE